MDLTEPEIIKTNYLFKLGLSQYYALNFLKAIKNLEKASQQFLQEKQYANYLKSQTILIVMYTEMENFDEIDKIENAHNTHSNFIENHEEIKIYHPRFYYYLSMCSIRRKDDMKAQAQINKALAAALSLQKEAQEFNDQKKLLLSRVDNCYISYSFTWIHIINNQIPEAIQELNNMQKLIEHLKHFNKKYHSIVPTYLNKDHPLGSFENLKEEIKSLELLQTTIEAHICSIEKKYDSAERLYWHCYEQSQSNYKKRYLSAHLLCFLGNTYMNKGDYEQAGIFLKLAQKSANPDLLKRVSRRITESIEKLKVKKVNNYDIVVNFENKTIIEKQKGQIDFKNQFILLDMLKLLISQPGNVHSKESLVEKIWQQKYNPIVHDNKIYVTIKRLRELLEPDHKNPKYIFRAKEGYYINKEVKTLIKS